MSNLQKGSDTEPILDEFIEANKNWWKEVKDKPEKWWNEDKVAPHLEKACEVFESLYNLRTGNGKNFDEVLRDKTLPDEALLYIFYKYLILLLQQDFKQALPEKWSEGHGSDYYTKLTTVGAASTPQMPEICDALLCIRKATPRDLAAKLDKHIKIWDERFHEEFGKNAVEDWKKKFSFEKAALLMVLQCWHQQYLSVTLTNSKLQLEQKKKRSSLPLHPNYPVILRHALIKKNAQTSSNDDTTPLKDITIIVTPTPATADAIEIRSDNMVRDSYTENVTTWMSAEHDLAFEIRQKSISSSLSELEFIVEAQDDQQRTFYKENFKIASHFNAPINLHEDFHENFRKKCAEHLQEIRVVKKIVNDDILWDIFLNDVITNIHIDEEAGILLQAYFKTLERKELLEEFCIRLGELIITNNFPYLGPKQLNDAWKAFGEQIADKFKLPSDDVQRSLLKALWLALSPDKKLPEDTRNVPLGSILERYESKGGQPDTGSILSAMNELISQRWCVEDATSGTLYRFSTPAHWHCVYNEFFRG